MIYSTIGVIDLIDFLEWRSTRENSALQRARTRAPSELLLGLRRIKGGVGGLSNVRKYQRRRCLFVSKKKKRKKKTRMTTSFKLLSQPRRALRIEP